MIQPKHTTASSSLVERLFAAGAHFAFTKSRRHPTVTPYIFGNKQGTDIFDLEKSAALIEAAKVILKDYGQQGKTVLFVATKEEISPLIKDAALSVRMPYVTNRWIGGMLTNFSEIKKRIERMKQLEAETASGALERKYVKRERVVIAREIEKLKFNFGGIAAMERRPDVLLVVDPRHDSIAVAEASDLRIPVIAIMSSDCDVKKVTHPVVVNDSLRASVAVTLAELTGAFAEGQAAPIARPPRTPSTRPVPTK